MTAAQMFEQVTNGGTNDFALVVQILEASRQAWCLFGGLAINVYVEPVFTVDADFVLVTAAIPGVVAELEHHGFRIAWHPFTVNAQKPGSDLVIQFSIDERFQDFPARAVSAEVLGVPVKVAALADLFSAKLLAWSDPERRPTKRAKDELDLLRIAERFSEYRDQLPEALHGKL